MAYGQVNSSQERVRLPENPNRSFLFLKMYFNVTESFKDRSGCLPEPLGGPLCARLFDGQRSEPPLHCVPTPVLVMLL